MPTTRKQKKARKSRGLEMLSDIENLDVMLGTNQFSDVDREESLNSNLAGRRESVVSNHNENDKGEMCSNNNLGIGADCGQNSACGNSSAEINKLSSELNSRLSRELDEMMGSVKTQIQRAISDAISNQILSQIQNALHAESGHSTQNRWNVPSERPEVNPEETYGESLRKIMDVSNALITKMVVNLNCVLTTLIFLLIFIYSFLWACFSSSITDGNGGHCTVWVIIQLEAFLTTLLATVLQLIEQFNQYLPK